MSASMALAEFLDSRCARFVRDSGYRKALLTERFWEESVITARVKREQAEQKQRNAAYKARRRT